jgi:hypothetical protein
MAIYKLIANGSFGPEEIKVMTEATLRRFNMAVHSLLPPSINCCIAQR